MTVGAPISTAGLAEPPAPAAANPTPAVARIAVTAVSSPIVLRTHPPRVEGSVRVTTKPYARRVPVCRQSPRFTRAGSPGFVVERNVTAADHGAAIREPD